MPSPEERTSATEMQAGAPGHHIEKILMGVPGPPFYLRYGGQSIIPPAYSSTLAGMGAPLLRSHWPVRPRIKRLARGAASHSNACRVFLGGKQLNPQRNLLEVGLVSACFNPEHPLWVLLMRGTVVGRSASSLNGDGNINVEFAKHVKHGIDGQERGTTIS